MVCLIIRLLHSYYAILYLLKKILLATIQIFKNFVLLSLRTCFMVIVSVIKKLIITYAKQTTNKKFHPHFGS